MSTWKKAAKSNQKVHRERHQPASREHLGILEKKKDYKKRAEDQHEKDETLKLLRKRALNKNPDEFYHHMVNSKVVEGEHHEVEKEDEHTPDQIKLMQTQDIKYIIMRRTIEKKKIQRLQSHLHMIDMANQVPNKHTFFVDSDDEAKNFDVAARLNTHPSLLDRRTNRIKVGDLEKMSLDQMSAKQLEQLNDEKQKLYKELEKRIDREGELAVVQKKMELKKKLQEKRAIKPRRVKAGTKISAPVYEFKYERRK